MPGDLSIYGEGQPLTEEQHQKLLGWCLEAYNSADAARKPFEDKWTKFYRAYRSFVKKRAKGDWRSRVYMPESFNQIETILPRLVAQLPKFNVNPVGPEDVGASKVMEFLLNYSAENSRTEDGGEPFYKELVKAFKDALMYGTGIMKIYHGQVPETKTELVTVFENVDQEVSAPLMDPETGMPMMDPDGNMVMDTQTISHEVPVGVEPQPKEFIAYDGPVAECIDPWMIWASPESDSVESARYLIHKVYKPVPEIKKLIERGIYQWFAGELTEAEVWGADEDDPAAQRLNEVGLGGGGDTTRRDAEVLEFWTKDGRVITVVNQKAVVRVQKNPYFHKMKPFVRFTDYLMPHEFYGVGEVEAIEGLQDLVNSTVNRRLDEVNIRLHGKTVVNEQGLVARGDLAARPGQTIRIKGDGRPDDIVKFVDLPDVNSSAYEEVDRARRMIERTTGASGVQQGTDSPINDTATGISIIQEMGANRFGFKSKLFELDPLKTLGKQFGSIIQQFTDQERVVRMLGPNGQAIFQMIDPLAIQGAFDFSIEPSSIIQSETVKREQAMGLFNTLSPLLLQMPVDRNTGMAMPLPPGVQALVEDILESFGKKDKAKYLGGQQALPTPTADQSVPSEGVTPSSIAPGA